MLDAWFKYHLIKSKRLIFVPNDNWWLLSAKKNFRRLVGWKTTFLACFEEKLIWKMISERVCLGWDDCLSHLCCSQLVPIDGNSDNFLIIVMMVVMVIIMIMITHNFHGFQYEQISWRVRIYSIWIAVHVHVVVKSPFLGQVFPYQIGAFIKKLWKEGGKWK